VAATLSQSSNSRPFLVGLLDLEDKATTILITQETTDPTTHHHIPEDLKPQFSSCDVRTVVGHREFNNI
jgi:hypothetical protein